MKLSIRWVLIIGILAIIWATQIITITTSYVSSQRALLAHAQDIMRDIADLAMEQTENHLSHAQTVAHLTKRLLTADVVGRSRDRLEELERYFADQLTVYPHFASIYFGEPNGDFFDVRRSSQKVPGGIRTKITVHQEEGKITRLVWRDRAHRLIAEETHYDDAYDPRQRPWYRKALAEKRIVWTDPYIFFTSNKPGITIAGPAFRGNGQLKGVVGVDLEIDELSTFISKLRIGKNGRAFMLNRNGELIAFPDPSKIAQRGEGAAYRLTRIEELDDAISRKAFTAMHWQFDDQKRFLLEAPRFGEFHHEAQTYHAMFTPFSEHQWPWVIGVYIPENDYIGTIKANRRFNIYVTLVCSLLATGLGLWLARSIIRPIASLGNEAQAISRKDFTSRFPTGSVYGEIQATADAFTAMKSALRKSKERYRSMFENIQDIYYESGMDGTLLEISPSVAHETQYTREELLGISVYRLYQDPADRDALLQHFLVHNEATDYEVVLRDKNDERLYCSINSKLLRHPDGTPQKIVGSLRVINERKQVQEELETYRRELEALVDERTGDLRATNQKLLQEIEQRKQTAAALRESEERYRTVLDDILEGYFETDMKGRLKFFNDSLCRILGYSRDELLNMNGLRFMAEASSAKIVDVFRGIGKKDTTAKIPEVEIFRKDRAHRKMELSVSLIKNQHGNVTGYRGLVRDVTERLQAERERRRLEVRFHQAQRLKGIGTLAGGVAHDFNNLLMGIQGNVSVLKMDLEPDSEAIENLLSIQQCVESGAKLTQQLLGFARGGKYVVEPTDINDIVRSTSQMFGRTRKEILLYVHYDEDIWPVNVDQKQIEQVLLNMYINAWQAMPQGGELYLRTENIIMDEQRSRLFDIESGNYVRIIIKDTGVGMDQETLQRIFEPFFTTKEIGTGTGLGLASAFGIIKNHNGFIDVRSRRDQGSTFTIYLPAFEGEIPVKEVPPNDLPPGTETILLVDDEETILDACGIMLQRMGYNVITAQGGHEAMAVYQEQHAEIDMVILDIIMPDINGGEVFDHLVEINPHVKVLLSSGYTIEDQAAVILERGCNGFIQKPYEMERLNRSIREVLTS
jgi:PAS domain S-box-containing protein